MTLEDERDLTNSASERVLFPENFILLDYMLSQIISIIPGEFNEKNIKKNLAITKGAILTEKIMIELVDKGIGRQEGHEIMRKTAIEAKKKNISMKTILMNNPKIKNIFNETEIDSMLDPGNYLGKAEEQVEILVKKLRKKYL